MKLLSAMKMNMRLEYSLTPYTKINYKQIKKSNFKDGYYEILEKNINRTQLDIKYSKFFMESPLRIMRNHKSQSGTELTLKAFACLKQTLKERQGQSSE